MKKLLLLPLFLLLVSELSAQRVIKTENITDHSIHIIGDSFEGAIFTKEYDISGFIMEAGKRFTPTIAEIELAEKLLNQNMDTLYNGGSQSKSIHKHLQSYLRQYFGYLNKNGERIIYINSMFKSSVPAHDRKWMTQMEITLDGGFWFWQVKFNLNTSQLFDFVVNGIG